MESIYFSKFGQRANRGFTFHAQQFRTAVGRMKNKSLPKLGLKLGGEKRKNKDPWKTRDDTGL